MAITFAPWMRRFFGFLWNPERGWQKSGPRGGAAESGIAVTDERALQISAVFRCIRIIAETSALLPLHVYRRSKNGELQLLTEADHWLPALLERPNPTMTGDEWREAMVAQMAGWGNAYTDVIRRETDSSGRPLELWPYVVDRMEVERLRDRSLRYRYPDPDGRAQDRDPSRVLHFRAFSVDGIMGQSPLALARQSLGLTIAAEQYAGSFFAHGGRPAGTLSADRVLTPAQREALRKEFGGLADGGQASGQRLWVLEAALKYQAITVSPEDMQMLQTRAFQIQDIARFFGVPLHLLAVQENTPNWGLETQNLAFLTYTLMPYLGRIERTIRHFLIPEEERASLIVKHDVEPLLAVDKKALGEFLSSTTQNGLMTRNEGRRRLGLPSVAGADKLTAQSNLAPLERLGEAPRPAVAAGAPANEEASAATQRDVAAALIIKEKLDPVAERFGAIEAAQERTERALADMSGAITLAQARMERAAREFAENKSRLKRTVDIPIRGPDGRIERVIRNEEFLQ